MRCRRAFDADLAAVLRGDAGDADFLAHYPTCPDCAAEVQVWRELDGMLRAGVPNGADHPAPEVLLAFADAPTALAGAVRSGVEQHLTVCRVCADELRALARFDPALLVEPAPAAPAPRAAAAVGAAATTDVSDDVSGAGGWLGRVVWHPAFAYALVAVLLIPLLRDQLGRIPIATRSVDPRHAERRQAPESAIHMAPAALPAAPPPAPPGVVQAPLLAESQPAPPSAGNESGRVDERASRFDDQVAARAMGRAEDSEDGLEEAPAPAGGAGYADARDDKAPPELAGPAQPAPLELPRVERGIRAPEADGAAAAQGALSARSRGGAAPNALAKSEAAAAPAAPPGAGSASMPTVEVRSNAPAVVPLAVAESGVVLRLVPPTGFAVGAIDIQVRGRAGGHAITTRVTDRADAIAVRIPPRWLAPGDYIVTLSPVDAAPNGAAGTPAILGFTVTAPTAPAAGR